MLTLTSRNASPRVLGKIDPDPIQPGVAIEEVLRQAQAERFGLAHRPLRRQRIDGVLHGVGRQHRAVVAVGIRGVVVTFEADGDGQVAQIVTIRLPEHLDEPDARFAVGRLNDHAELRTQRPRGNGRSS